LSDELAKSRDGGKRLTANLQGNTPATGANESRAGNSSKEDVLNGNHFCRVIGFFKLEIESGKAGRVRKIRCCLMLLMIDDDDERHTEGRLSPLYTQRPS
jgi:hypothetical protein